MPRTVAIIQARTGSTRLPRKVLADLAGEPLLVRVVERVSRSRRLDAVVVATTMLPDDDAIEALSRVRGWLLTRGSEQDLLDRYVGAAREHKADVVVRVTSDCPLVDSDLLDEVVDARARWDADYASNTLEPRTYPRGLDIEALTIDALEQAWYEDDNPAWREHVTPYLYRNPERFRLHRVAASEDESAHRWTVDTAADLELVRHIYAAIGRTDFGWRDALDVVRANPEWVDLNRDVPQKAVG